MADRFSLLVVSGSGKFVKKAHCAYWILYATSSALLLFMLIFAFVIADYINISRKDLNKTMLEAELAVQSQELLQHRQQIQKFAREINRLKNRMVEISQVDQQIRRVAEMDESAALFGVGGSAPEDLNPDIELERKHTQLIIEMHRQVGELQNASVYQQNSLNDLWKVVEERGNFMAYTPTIRPAAGRISSGFGYRESPFTGKLEFHNGLDIANYSNTEIIATAHGRISFVGETRGFGRLVMIEHGHGLTTRYAHLDRILKSRGDIVKRGDVIGYMGNTGRSTGTHLHYEVRLNGMPVNPKKYFFN
jgi:murein DD-endopeptidase MepM/ murein hydrolase activator NlpD